MIRPGCFYIYRSLVTGFLISLLAIFSRLLYSMALDHNAIYGRGLSMAADILNLMEWPMIVVECLPNIPFEIMYFHSHILKIDFWYTIIENVFVSTLMWATFLIPFLVLGDFIKERYTH
jgi:hypothetical protein